ncbi:MAG TPA: GIY-YIG nuclease family protein [Patescibacteria group bacterium]|nr:GIY-YIG nuclease family protein [Patescibacteria group bacterium]
MWYVYIVECNDGSFYTGITTDIERRIFEHNNKTGAKSVRGKLPVKLVYHERAKNNASAARREREIKGWNRTKKQKLIES